MIKEDFWKRVSEVWSQKEEIDIPVIDPGEVPPDEPIEEPEDGIPFDDIEDLDDFFKDFLS